MKNLTYFRNKTVMISGAASGLGRALARTLSHDGIKLVLLDIDGKNLKEFTETLFSKTAFAYEVDVRDYEKLQATIALIEKEHGFCEILINCAGITRLTYIRDLKVQDAVDVMDTNFKGTMYLVTLLADSMIQREKGHIVGISSMAALRGLPHGAYYSASKAAINRFLESLRIDLRDYGVLVTSCMFGFIDTPMNSELKKLYKTPFSISAEDAAKIVLRSIAKKKRVSYDSFFNLFLSILIKTLPSFLWDRVCIKDRFSLRVDGLKRKIRKI